MKNYQKNSRNPSVPFSCMLEQLMAFDQVKSIKGHLFNHIWSLNLNLVFKPTSFNLLLVVLAQNTFILPCLMHASYCCILFGNVCVSVLSAAGSVPEEYRDYPNEEPYQCIEPSGKQPTI